MSPYQPFLNRETRSSSLLVYLHADFFPTERDFTMGFEWLGVEPKAITRVASDDYELHLSIAREHLAPIAVRRVRAPPIEEHVLETMQLDTEEQVAELARSVWALHPPTRARQQCSPWPMGGRRSKGSMPLRPASA